MVMGGSIFYDFLFYFENFQNTWNKNEILNSSNRFQKLLKLSYNL